MEQATYTVDVIIPTFNTGTFIAPALQSVLQQTYPIQKIFVIDDGSTDNTKDMVLEIAQHALIPIEYSYQENAGPNSARNNGLRRSNSTFVAFLDADDVWMPEKIEKQILVYKNSIEKNLALVYCKYNTIDKNGLSILTEIIPIDKNIRGNCFDSLLIGNKILASASGVLIKRNTFQEVGFFDETLRMAEDWDMWLRIAQNNAIDYVDDVLVSIRRHTSNQTNNIQKVLIGEIKFLNKWTKILKQKHTPLVWADRISQAIILALSKNNLLREAKKLLSEEARAKIFARSFGSIELHTFFFIIRSVLNISKWKKLLIWNKKK